MEGLPWCKADGKMNPFEPPHQSSSTTHNTGPGVVSSDFSSMDHERSGPRLSSRNVQDISMLSRLKELYALTCIGTNLPDTKSLTWASQKKARWNFHHKIHRRCKMGSYDRKTRPCKALHALAGLVLRRPVTHSHMSYGDIPYSTKKALFCTL
jgi:hypothetical protein